MTLTPDPIQKVDSGGSGIYYILTWTVTVSNGSVASAEIFACSSAACPGPLGTDEGPATAGPNSTYSFSTFPFQQRTGVGVGKCTLVVKVSGPGGNASAQSTVTV